MVLGKGPNWCLRVDFVVEKFEVFGLDTFMEEDPLNLHNMR